MLIIGLDQGFSVKSRSTGVVLADVDGGLLRPVDGPYHCRAAEAREWLKSHLWRDIRCVALDAPIGTPTPTTYRPVERVFSIGLFQKLCKPGSSGAPVGRALAAWAAETVRALGTHVAYIPFADLLHWQHGTAVIETFPTTTLAVLQTPSALPTCKRGEKTDRYFETVSATSATFAGVQLDATVLPNAVRNHDERMALICALVSAWYVRRDYRAVGSSAGYFVLPPKHSWHPDWEKALQESLAREPRASVIDALRK